MLTVRDLLKIKGDAVWSIEPKTTVLEALNFMAEKEVGALLVLEGEKMSGIISERDFVRAIAKYKVCKLDATVDAYMTTEVFTVQPDHTVEDCMQLMTGRHIRHLPVIVEGKVVGLISIGDVVKGMISSREQTIDQLSSYIEGRGYGS